MKVIQGKGKIKLVVVCCLHGDEVFGAKVFRYFEPRISQIKGLRLVFANQTAYQKKTRYINSDLNRAFPGKKDGNHEQKLAHDILPFIQGAEFVLDIHTTNSDIRMTPIVCSLNTNVFKVINLTSSQEVALMSRQMASHALIGQVDAGVSLEFNEVYADAQGALDEVVKIINGMLSKEQKSPRPRKIFSISGTIPLKIKLPATAKNFERQEPIDGYPFLLRERAYVGLHRGFLAKKVEDREV